MNKKFVPSFPKLSARWASSGRLQPLRDHSLQKKNGKELGKKQSQEYLLKENHSLVQVERRFCSLFNVKHLRKSSKIIVKPIRHLASHRNISFKNLPAYNLNLN